MSTERIVPLFERQIWRIANPHFQNRFSPHAESATEFLFERVSALAYAAYRWGDEEERYFANLASTTLGRLRDARFVTPTLQSQRFELRQIAVASLAFLMDPHDQLASVATEDPDPVVRAAAEWGMNFVESIREATS
jgi:hypothetical protein